jgi:hypothetical protein
LSTFFLPSIGVGLVALETDVDVTDGESTRSLNDGVPGGPPVILGRREPTLELDVAMVTGDEIIDGSGFIIVSVMRKVLGTIRLGGSTALGVAGRESEFIEDDDKIVLLVDDSVSFVKMTRSLAALEAGVFGRDSVVTEDDEGGIFLVMDSVNLDKSKSFSILFAGVVALDKGDG